MEDSTTNVFVVSDPIAVPVPVLLGIWVRRLGEFERRDGRGRRDVGNLVKVTARLVRRSLCFLRLWELRGRSESSSPWLPETAMVGYDMTHWNAQRQALKCVVQSVRALHIEHYA